MTPAAWGALCLSVLLPGGAPQPAAAADDQAVGRLVALLGSSTYEERRDATEALDALEGSALPALRRALTSADPEARRRARLLVQSIEGRLRDAEVFAQQFLDRAEFLEDNSVLGFARGEWVRRAVTLLYRHPSAGPVPPSLAARLDKAERLAPSELEVLLRDAYLGLARRGAVNAEAGPERLMMRVLRAADPYAKLDRGERFCRCGDFPHDVVGLELGTDPARGLPRVVTPILGSPAYRAGLRAGDRLVLVRHRTSPEGPVPETWDELPTWGRELAQVRRILLGRGGDRFRLTVARDGAGKLLEFQVTGGAVVRETVLGWRRRADDTWDYLLDPNGRIAYVRLTAFRLHTTKELDRVLDQLQKEPLGGLVLDLRFNPGGLLAEAIDTAGLFLDCGPILRVQGVGNKVTPFHAGRPGRRFGFPMVCLVNGASAAGSEVVAAAL